MSEENKFIDILRNELIHDISDREKAMLEDWSHSNDDNRSFRQLIREMKLSSEIEKKEEEMKSYILQEVHKRINRSRYIRRLLKIVTMGVREKAENLEQDLLLHICCQKQLIFLGFLRLMPNILGLIFL